MDISNIEHLGHATVKIRNSCIIYIDPFDISTYQKDADIILCTHGHFDHLSIDDIAKVKKETTILYVAAHDYEEAKKTKIKTIMRVMPNNVYESNHITVATVPAYNVNKHFHPKSNNWVGYIITCDGFTVYHSGDTDVIDEMKNVKADVALLPVGGTYTMDWKEALKAVGLMKIRYAVPIHFGNVIGSYNDAQNFIYGLPSTVIGKILLNRG